MRNERAIHTSMFGCIVVLVGGAIALNQYALRSPGPLPDQVASPAMADATAKPDAPMMVPAEPGAAVTINTEPNAAVREDVEPSASITANADPVVTLEAPSHSIVTDAADPDAVVLTRAEPDLPLAAEQIGDGPPTDASESLSSHIPPELATIDVRTYDRTDDCPALAACVDQYLWFLYDRTSKVDANKVTEKHKLTVKRKGKTRTIVKIHVRFEDQDFAWKDPAAAENVGLPLKDYVIGGMDPTFKQTLYHALRAMDDAGMMPGITSAFRDDYRQTIASGNKAATGRSFHGGSSRGGYGHGLAVDVVSMKGETRAERLRSSAQLWAWIDAHGKDYGIARPYLDRDPPHVGPIDGQEYAMKRGGTTPRPVVAAKTTPQRLARVEPRRPIRAATVASPKATKGVKTFALSSTATSAATPSRQARRTAAVVQPQKQSRKLSAARTAGAL